MADLFSSEALQETWQILSNEFLLATWETFYVTILSTFFSIVIGLPLGVLLVTGEKGGIRPLPAPFMHFLNVIINLLPLNPSSKPFL